ncbi:unnamed protein product, partial [Leptidea sinapis]
MKMRLDKKLLPIKGHFFLFNAATVGIIYTVLPIFGLIAKPLFGVIADRFRIQKSIFILFQIITILSFLAIYFIPENASSLNVELDCGNGATIVKSCYQSADLIDQSKVISLGNQNATAECRMTCDMTSPKMWETVCEHWKIPKYCYNNTDQIQYKSYISDVTIRYHFKPSCRIGDGFVDINEPCTLNCTNQYLSQLVGHVRPNMTCVDQMLNYRFCGTEITPDSNLNTTDLQQCMICLGWGADVTDTCHPKTQSGQHLPSKLSFTGNMRLSSTSTDNNCVYIKLNHIKVEDGSIHYPNCISKAQYEMEMSLFHPSCEIDCDNAMLNELLFHIGDTSDEKEINQFTRQFWLFFMLMIINWIGQAVVVTFADAICFNLLGTRISQYGKQRLWGSVGFGIFSLLAGTLIDLFSDGYYKDYTISFVLMFVFMSGDVAVSCFLNVETTKFSVNILADVGSLVKSVHTCVFIVWTIAVGLCTALVWQFLFWHIEDVAKLTTEGSNYVKTLQGLVSAIQTFGGEIPFLFVSGYILKKLGHINVMSIVLFAFGVRFLLYSYLTNPWWILPIEMFQGITFGMFYPTMTSYANVVSPPGTETTVQGLVGAIFEGVGTSLGSFIGGRLYETHGGWNTFRWFGIGAFIACFLHAFAQYLIKDKSDRIGLNNQGYTSVIRYGQPTDSVFTKESVFIKEPLLYCKIFTK